MFFHWRKQPVKPLILFSQKKPSRMLACEGLTSGYPSDVCQTGDRKQLNTTVSLILSASVKSKISFPCCHLPLLYVRKEKKFAYPHKYGKWKMHWWKSFVNSLEQKGLNGLCLSSHIPHICFFYQSTWLPSLLVFPLTLKKNKVLLKFFLIIVQILIPLKKRIGKKFKVKETKIHKEGFWETCW